MKRWVAGLLLLAVLGGLTWYFLGSKRETSPATSQNAEMLSALSNVAPGPATNIPAPPVAFHPAPATEAGESQPGPVTPPPPTAAISSPVVQAMTAPNPDDPRPAALLENVRNAVIQYGSMFGGNPVGNNTEITKALNGGNPKQVNFIKPEAGMHINGNGELVDSWGTPFFFHQLSGTEMEIRSAGPDRMMWTSDDLVIK
jgi:hypothetical protein